MLAVLFLGFNATHIFAQKKLERAKTITVEFLIPNRKYKNKLKISIHNNSKGKLELVGGNVDECGIPEECKDYVGSSYMLFAKAFKTGRTKTTVNFNIEVNDACKTKRTFTVNRNGQTKLRLGCGVSLTAYY